MDTSSQPQKDPKHLASLAVALLQSDSHDRLLAISSPHIKDKYLLTNKIDTLFQWKYSPMNYHSIDLSSPIVKYRVLDSETTHCMVKFGQVCVILFYVKNDNWAYHDIYEHDDESEWQATLQAAKRAYARDDVMDQDDDDEYWALYDQKQAATSNKRPNEHLDQEMSDADYWNSY